MDCKPIATIYKNKVDFEEELLRFGDDRAMVERLAADSELKFDNDEERFRYNLQHAAQSGVGTTFNNMLRTAPLEDEVTMSQKKQYRQWLLQMFDDVKDVDIPLKGPVKPGIRFPIPCGSQWRAILENDPQAVSQRLMDAADTKSTDEALLSVRIMELTIGAAKLEEAEVMLVRTLTPMQNKMARR